MSVAILPDVRDRAQGPFTIGSEKDGGYYLSLSDLPTSFEVRRDPARRRVAIRFGYEDDHSHGDVSDELQWSTQFDGLRLVAFFSNSRRRLLLVQFLDCNIDVDPDHLADGAASALESLSAKALGDDLTPNQLLALKAVAVVFRNGLAAAMRGSR